MTDKALYYLVCLATAFCFALSAIGLPYVQQFVELLTITGIGIVAVMRWLGYDK